MAALPLAQLRARIAAMDGGGWTDRADILPFGIPEIDAALPWGGLPLGTLHDISAPKAVEAEASALGFAALCLGRLAAHRAKPVLWIAGLEDLYAPGLAALGLSPERLVVVRPARGAQLLWAMEEGLRCSALGGLVGEVWDLDFTAARRLHLAARASGVTAFLLHRGNGAAERGGLTHWRVGPAPTEQTGGWCWDVALSRCRGRGAGEGQAIGRWRLEWRDETHRLRLAAVSGHRPVVPEPAVRFAG